MINHENGVNQLEELGKIASLEERINIKLLLEEKLKELSNFNSDDGSEESLKDLKLELKRISKKCSEMNKLHLNDTLFQSYLLKNCIVLPSFEIYGGVSGLKDLGPLGCSLKNNLIKLWRKHFVIEEEMIEIETSSLIFDEVYKAFGFYFPFEEHIVKANNTTFIASRVIEDFIETKLNNCDLLTSAQIIEFREILANINSYDSYDLDRIITRFGIKSQGGHQYSQVYRWTKLFETQIGATGKTTMYLRPDLDQGLYTNFRRLHEYSGKRLPFAVAQVGSIFNNNQDQHSNLKESYSAKILHFFNNQKNEQTYKNNENVVLRIIESEDESEISINDALERNIVANPYLAYYMARTQQFMEECGFLIEGIRFRKQFVSLNVEQSWTCEVLTQTGWLEVVTIQKKYSLDLNCHSNHSNTDLSVFEPFGQANAEQEIIVEISKKELGKRYKSESKDLIYHLENLSKEQKYQYHNELKINNKISLNINQKNFELSKEDISFVEQKVYGEKIIPHVISISFSISRILSSLLEHAFCIRSTEDKIVLSIPSKLAPIKILLISNSKTSENMVMEKVTKILKSLSIPFKQDETGSVGRRYVRADEIGIPYSITIDQDSLLNETVAVRFRDTCLQERVETSALRQFLLDQLGK